jgi:Zn-dependent peptidase ImmA (M78 family)
MDKSLPLHTTVRHYPSFLEFVHCGTDTVDVETLGLQPPARADLSSSCMQAIEKLRSVYETSVPPFTLQGLLEHFCVAEVRERLLDRDARLIVEGGRIIIEVNSIFPKVRRRLSVAHEIGHMIVNECDGRSKLSVSHGDPSEESLCNRLAGELLVPGWALRDYLGREPELIAQGDCSIRCSTVLAAASVFGVSVDVICRRIFQDLALAPGKVAIIWRERENSRTKSSERALRICSVWRSSPNLQFIPLNKTAPAHSVISQAFRNGGLLFQEEDLTIGRLIGRFEVEAGAFKCLALPGSGTRSTAILSLLEQVVSAP